MGHRESFTKAMSAKAKIYLVGSHLEDGDDDASSVVPVLYDVDDIAKIREHGVAGVLIGTLGGAPQQNVFLGVPLRLMMEEALWLVEVGHAVFRHVTGQDLIKSLKGLDGEKLQKFKDDRANDVAQQLEWKRANFLRKMKTLRSASAVAVPSDVINEKDEQLMKQSIFIETKDTSAVIELSLNDQTIDQRKICEQILGQDEKLRLNYKVYKKLREMGYFMSPGARFGGRYVAYPGDPLRYHSHLTVQDARSKDEDIDLLNMINGARLGTSVKKTWVLPGINENGDAEFYSVEWAGFG
ncbi:Sen34 [Kluyveromyces lactis]|nr:Sen34 [Kluyveromyces lactis]